MYWMIGIGVIILIAMVDMLKCHFCFQVEQVRIANDKIPDAFLDTKIVFLSDLHNASYGKENLRLIREIEKEQPDYIFLGGDIYTRSTKQNQENARKVLHHLGEIAPVYYVYGNHESDMKRNPKEYHMAYQQILKDIEQSRHITMMNNKKVILRKAQQEIVLQGIELDENCYKKFKYHSLTIREMEKKIGKRQKQDEFCILLAHTPNYFPVYEQWGADLVFSGHNHGGIARLPLIGGILSTQAVFFPKYSSGLYYRNQAQMVVSPGMGGHTIDLRLFNPPKVLVVTLEKN